MAHGMDEYIAKPINLRALHKKIEQVTIQSLVEKNSASLEMDTLWISEDGTIHFHQDEIEENDLQEYSIDEVEQLIGKLKEMVIAEDFQSIERLAHQLKERFSNMGAVEMKTLAFKIELAARRSHLVNIQKELNLIKKEWDFFH